MNRLIIVVGLVISLAWSVARAADSSIPCAAGARCFRVDSNGSPSVKGPLIAQCSGQFPDFVDRVPESHTGSRFVLRQDFPTSLPTNEPIPWLQNDFMTQNTANAYMMAVRNYVYEGMREVDWRAEKNTKRRWYHVPWMTTGRHPREFIRGLTEERPLSGPELGLRPGVTVQNWAVGFYNSIGAYAIGQVWKNPNSPNPAAARSPEGTVVAKVLFTSARSDDFSGPDPVAGAPEWAANVFKAGSSTEKEIKTLRLMQMDVAVRRNSAGASGWIFGTFAYDPRSKDPDTWNRMMPVGLMWGNDPTLTDSAFKAGSRPKESIVSDMAPPYAADHLGRSGRMNGPVDNPVSSCLSCHSTAQVPAVAPMFPFPKCGEKQILRWFRNLPGGEAFGAMDRNTCEPRTNPPSDQKPIAVDYSLQVATGIANQLAVNAVNSCSPLVKPFAADPQRKARSAGGVEIFNVER